MRFVLLCHHTVTHYGNLVKHLCFGDMMQIDMEKLFHCMWFRSGMTGESVTGTAWPRKPGYRTWGTATMPACQYA